MRAENNGDRLIKIMAANELKARFGRSILWTGTSRACTQGFLLASVAILARLLSPRDIGLMSLCLIYVQFLDQFIDAGFVNAIVQAHDNDQKSLDTCFWFMCTICGLIYAVTWAGAPLAARFTESAELLPKMLRVATLVLLFVPFQVPALGALSRRVQVDIVAKIEFVTGLLKAVISIFLALVGYGIWSLVFGYMAGRILTAIGIFFVSGWRPKTGFDLKVLRKLGGYGTAITFSRILWFLQSRVDAIVIGHFLGAQVLGFYSVGKQLFDQMAVLFSMIYSRVVFPAFAEIHNDGRQVGAALLKTIRGFSIVIIPISLLLGAIATPVVSVVFGSKWDDASTILGVLGWVGGLRMIEPIIAMAVNAVGRPKVGALVNAFQLAAIGVATFLGSQLQGLGGVAYSIMIAYPVMFIVTQLLEARIVGVNFSDVLRQVLPGAFFGLALLALVMSTEWFFHSSSPTNKLGAMCLTWLCFACLGLFGFLRGRRDAIVSFLWQKELL